VSGKITEGIDYRRVPAELRSFRPSTKSVEKNEQLEKVNETARKREEQLRAARASVDSRSTAQTRERAQAQVKAAAEASSNTPLKPSAEWPPKPPGIGNQGMPGRQPREDGPEDGFAGARKKPLNTRSLKIPVPRAGPTSTRKNPESRWRKRPGTLRICNRQKTAVNQCQSAIR
jgi:hypothetical protein